MVCWVCSVENFIKNKNRTNYVRFLFYLFVVAEERLELSTSALWVPRSNQLSYPANFFNFSINRLPSQFGAWGGTWTRTGFLPRDFKSLVYTNSTTQAYLVWARKDLNLHALRHWFLRPACLPIPPLARVYEYKKT